MSKELKSSRLIVPVYINEKIVLDMLAIIEDGFSTVSQVNYTEHKDSGSAQRLEGGLSTSATLLSKLLKINLSGEASHTGNSGQKENILKEKVHTNVSLLSKFRSFLVDENVLKSSFDVSQMQIGDFIEVEGELQKNPLINYLDIFVDVLRLTNIFADQSPIGDESQEEAPKPQENALVNQIESLANELKHSGTIDFILSDTRGTVVLSAQEQYLANDNISEILGGRFKVLGKVIAVCKDKGTSIDLLRKTTFSVFPSETLAEMFDVFKNEDGSEQLNLPEFVTKIDGPAVIIIPIAIYA